MRRDARRDKLDQLFRRRLRLQHHEGLGHFAGVLIGAGNHGGVRDGRMRQQDGLQLGRRHLVSLVLDQLLEAIHDIEVAVRVGVANVAGVQPAIVIENLRGGGRVVEIALHHLGTANQDLAVGLRTELFSGGDVDHFAFAAGDHGANRSDLYPFDVVAHQVRRGTGFGHAVTLVDLAVEALATSLGQVLIQGRGAGKDQGH